MPDAGAQAPRNSCSGLIGDGGSDGASISALRSPVPPMPSESMDTTRNGPENLDGRTQHEPGAGRATGGSPKDRSEPDMRRPGRRRHSATPAATMKPQQDEAEQERRRIRETSERDKRQAQRPPRPVEAPDKSREGQETARRHDAVRAQRKNGMDEIGQIIEVVSSTSPRARREPLADWWRPIARTPTPETYVTGAAALNIPDGDAWAGWHGLMWQVRLEGEEYSEANRAKMGHAADWPYWNEESLRDARAGLRLIGHPAAQRREPVYAATFARAVAEWVVNMAVARGEDLAYPEPHETRAWLTRHDDRRSLKALLAKVKGQPAEVMEDIERWIERTKL